MLSPLQPDEQALIEPLSGSSMLELGNKRSLATQPISGSIRDGTYKAYFEALGFRHVSVDMNGLDGALALDLTKPLGLGTFDVVTNFGTTEHVADQGACWRNVLGAMHDGSVLVSTTPLPGDWPGHGEHYPTPAFFDVLASLNGLAVERMKIVGERPRRLVASRLRRHFTLPFTFPNPLLIVSCQESS